MYTCIIWPGATNFLVSITWPGARAASLSSLSSPWAWQACIFKLAETKREGFLRKTFTVIYLHPNRTCLFVFQSHPLYSFWNRKRTQRYVSKRKVIQYWLDDVWGKLLEEHLSNRLFRLTLCALIFFRATRVPWTINLSFKNISWAMILLGGIPVPWSKRKISGVPFKDQVQGLCLPTHCLSRLTFQETIQKLQKRSWDHLVVTSLHVHLSRGWVQSVPWDGLLYEMKMLKMVHCKE